MVHEQAAEELISRLFRRCSNPVDTCSNQSRPKPAAYNTIAVTNLHELAKEFEATEQFTTNYNPKADFLLPLAIPHDTQPLSWNELEHSLLELHTLYERMNQVALTIREQKYVNSLTQIAVSTLTHACLSTNHDEFNISRMREMLLELAGRATSSWRQLVFTLFLRISVVTLAKTLSMYPVSSLSHLKQLESNLFTLLQELMRKAIVESPTSLISDPSLIPFQASQIDWLEQALECLEFFIKKPNGSFSFHRLKSLDVSTLHFLAVKVSHMSKSNTELQLKAMELIVASIYAFKLSTDDEWQQHSNESTPSNCRLSIEDVEKVLPLDLLLYYFYNASNTRFEWLLCMVLVDLVHQQLPVTGIRESIRIDQILHKLCVDWEDPSFSIKQKLLSPYVSNDQVVQHLASSCFLVSEKHLNTFVTQFRLLLNIEAYFGTNPRLNQGINRVKNNPNTLNELLDQVSKLLRSKDAVERFRGERWMAELLSNCNVLATRKQELEQRDEMEQRIQHQFFALSCPTNALNLRQSFVNVLTLLIRRTVELNGSFDPSILENLNTCLRVLLDTKETEADVLIRVMMLILDVCHCELSYIDKRWQERDSTTSCSSKQSICIATSDSLASRVLNGKVALHKALLQEINPDFFLHVLTVLLEHLEIECCGICSGPDNSFAQDVAACTSFIILHTLPTNQAALNRIGGIRALTPFMATRDTRITVFIAKLVSELVKQTDGKQYATFLRELYAVCIETDDEKTLSNSYLHTQTLLYSVIG